MNIMVTDLLRNPCQRFFQMPSFSAGSYGSGYHPADYWGYMKFSQEVNLQIARGFQKEGIKFAFPTSTTYLSQEDGQPLHVNLGGNLPFDRGKDPAGDKL